MKHWILGVGLCAAVPVLLAQDRIWRCGNEYTNTVTPEQAKGCKLVSGGNVTVVPAVKPASPTKAAAAPASAPRVQTDEQKAKDADARYILESELKKAEARQQELLREYNNGEPEKLASEVRNHQKYIERVAELKASMARNESDMAGIRRELARLGAGAAPGTGAAPSVANGAAARP
ncbi:MAG: hypothetical protein ACT4NV_01275 [Rhodoferax sp.]